MNIVVATSGFAAPGGSETYALTVAEQLERLQHRVLIYAEELGAMAAFATERGITVTGEPSDLDHGCDAILVQDGAMSYRLAERLPEVPQLFRATSELFDFCLPPALPGLVGAVVVCSDRVGNRIRSLPAQHTIHRLRQPIDTERFAPARRPSAHPRKAVLVGNYLNGARLDAIRGALARRGVECELIGSNGRPTCTPENEIWDADIVVAKGRAALEGMSCGKAVLVYDDWGGDGWVTAERYDAMEADNFAGQSRPPIATADALDEELAQYDPQMGIVNRELASEYHGARVHTNELCALLEAVPPPTGSAGAPLDELARLVRLQWRTETRAIALNHAARAAGEDAERERQRIAELAELNGSLSAELERVHREAQEIAAHGELLTAELDRRSAVLGTRRVRVGLALGGLADRIRRSRRDGSA